MWEFSEDRIETMCREGKRAQKRKIVMVPSFSQKCCFSESLLSHDIGTYCSNFTGSRNFRHGKRAVLACEMGIVSLLPKYSVGIKL